MKQKMFQFCTAGLLALLSVSALAEGQPDQSAQMDQEATKSWIALSAGAVAAAGPVAGTVHFYKKANKAAERGMSLEAYTNKKLRSDFLKEEEAATSQYRRGMVLSALVPATTILAAMNLFGLKQSDAKVAQKVEKAKTVQQVSGDVPQPVRTPAANASAF